MIEMSIQAILNQDAINMLPAIKHTIENASIFEANQMTDKAIREINSSSKSIADMSSDEREVFSKALIEKFQYFEWIK
jgi:hypothetical protein